MIDKMLLDGCTQIRDHIAYMLIHDKCTPEVYKSLKIVIDELDKAIAAKDYPEYDSHMDIVQFHMARARKYTQMGL